MSQTTQKHKSEAPKQVNFALITCSTSRYELTKTGKKVEDISGDLITELIEKYGYKVVYRKIVPDDRVMIQNAIAEALGSSQVQAIITCGGTGISPKDITIETVRPMLTKTLPGFGEIFRKLSYEQSGSAAILSRALAGIVDEKVVFCIPGSPDAVRLCVEKLILPEASHILKHAREHA
jgi:molybdenum cofactor biosynthesis protein B